MNKERLQQWIDALKSGEYKQTREEWRNEDGCFCVTAVAAEVAMKNGCNHLKWNGMLLWGFGWPIHHISEWYGISQDSVRSLVTLNDGGYTFEELVALLESMLKTGIDSIEEIADGVQE